MRVLVIKLTSMGDVLHVLPALSDLYRHHPKVTVDWMVEDSFAEIPAWHPRVQQVIRVATRRWRKLSWQNLREFYRFVRVLRSDKYNVVIDAQGLMKSAGLGRLARLNNGGKRVGFCSDSIKESFAAKFYSQTISIERDQHAIARLRQLFAKAFGYPTPAQSALTSAVDYQINLPGTQKDSINQRTVFFLHGTTWPSKHLPDQVWRDLRDLVVDDGYRVKIAWGNEAERSRAEWIAQGHTHVQVLPKLGLTELAKQIKDAEGAISVDTGLGHLAAALKVPAVSVYGSTDASLTGALGDGQIRIQTQYPCSPCLLKKCDKLTDQVKSPPCYQTLSAADIWQLLYEQIA